jgi:hypothetical protein
MKSVERGGDAASTRNSETYHKCLPNWLLQPILEITKESIQAVTGRIFRRRSNATSTFDRTTIWGCAENMLIHQPT